jgi:hypothetical protein
VRSVASFARDIAAKFQIEILTFPHTIEGLSGSRDFNALSLFEKQILLSKVHTGLSSFAQEIFIFSSAINEHLRHTSKF